MVITLNHLKGMTKELESSPVSGREFRLAIERSLIERLRPSKHVKHHQQ